MKKPRSLRKQVYPYYMVIPAFIMFSVFFVVPLTGGIFISFTDWNIMFGNKIKFNGFTNYINTFKDPFFIAASINTLVFTVAVVVLRNFFAFVLAVILTRNLKTATFLRTVFYLPAVLSYVVVGIIFMALFQMNGSLNQLIRLLGHPMKYEWLMNTKTALLTVIISDVWKWSGFFMMIYIAGIQAISKDYYESAVIDGASYLHQILYITVPLLIPAITVNVTLSLIGGIRVFEQVLTLTGGRPGHSSSVIGMIIYEYFSQGFYGKSTAASMFLSVFVLIVTVLLRRAFREREVAL